MHANTLNDGSPIKSGMTLGQRYIHGAVAELSRRCFRLVKTEIQLRGSRAIALQDDDPPLAEMSEVLK